MNSSTRCWVGIHLIHVWSGVGIRMYTGLLIRGHFWADLGPRPLVWAFIKSSPNVNLISAGSSLWVLIYLLVSPSLSTGQSEMIWPWKNFWSIWKILNFLNFRFLIFLIFNFTLFVIIKILIYNNDILPALWDIK